LVNQTLQIMKTRFLFPHSSRLLGYLCFAADILFAIVLKLLHPGGFAATELHHVPGSANDPSRDIDVIDRGMWLHNDITILLIIFGLLLIAFSKEKTEDELLSQLRLDSLQWAMYLNYAIFAICVILFHGLHFLPVIIFNVITPLVFFIIRFRWKVYLLNLTLNQN